MLTNVGLSQAHWLQHWFRDADNQFNAIEYPNRKITQIARAVKRGQLTSLQSLVQSLATEIVVFSSFFMLIRSSDFADIN